jgi:hypothetical protein
MMQSPERMVCLFPENFLGVIRGFSSEGSFQTWFVCQLSRCNLDLDKFLCVGAAIVLWGNLVSRQGTEEHDEMRNERKKVWVDEFQTRLMFRISMYLVLFVFCLANLLYIWRLLEEGPGNPVDQYARVLRDFAPVLIFLAFLMPVLAWDAIRFSHRLVGPLGRFRSAFQSLAAGQPVRPIKLRDGDFLVDMRDDFNQMLDALQRLGVPALKPTEANENHPERKPA